MTSDVKQTLEATVAGTRQVGRAIAALPIEHRSRALDAAERSYLQTAQALCCAGRAPPNQASAWASAWVSAVMVRLRAEEKEQRLAEQNALREVGRIGS